MKKLTKKWQLILYAISGMGINMLNLMMGSYLCSALITEGFKETEIGYHTFYDHSLVVAGIWAVFVTISKIVDGVIDIPMASFTDRLRTRWGRRRPSLIIGLVPVILAYVAFLFVPNPAGATVLNTVYFGIVLIIFYSFYTLTMVTYYATFTEIVETERERAIIANVKSVCDIVYFILGYVVVAALLRGHNVKMVALMVLPLSLTMFIPLFMIKEPSNKTGEISEEENPKLVKSIVYTFKNKAFIIWMIVYAFMTFGVQLFLGGINEYFSSTGMNMMFVMMASFAPVPFTLILYNKLLHSKGFVFAYRYTLIMYAIGMLLMFGSAFLPGTAKMVCSISTGIINSFSIGAMFAVAYSVPAQLAADEEKETGRSHAAMYFAVQGLFAGIATGIATGLVLTGLKKLSKDATAGAVTPMWFMTLICAGVILISLALTVFLPESLKKLGLKKES